MKHPQQNSNSASKAASVIQGLQYIKDYINEAQHDWLLARLDEHQWLDDLKRRVQHYGFKYNYKAGMSGMAKNMSGSDGYRSHSGR